MLLMMRSWIYETSGLAFCCLGGSTTFVCDVKKPDPSEKDTARGLVLIGLYRRVSKFLASDHKFLASKTKDEGPFIVLALALKILTNRASLVVELFQALRKQEYFGAPLK